MKEISKSTYRVTRLGYSTLYRKPRPVVVGLSPGDIITFREKGRRSTFTLHIADAFKIAIRAHAERERIAKRNKRRGLA